VLLLCIGCAPGAADRDEPAVPSGSGSVGAPSDRVAAGKAAREAARVAVLAETLFAPAPSQGPDAPAFPQDLGSHPGMPFESRSWYIVLSEPDGSVRALRQRFDRAALRTGNGNGNGNGNGGEAATGDGAPVPVGGSAWRFDALMQASGAQASVPADAAAVTTRGWQQVQRVALGLASSDWDDRTGQHDRAEGAEEAGGAGTGPSGGAFGVLGHRLTFAPGPRGCTGRYRLEGPGTGAIEIVQRGCPAGEAFAVTARAGSGAMVARAADGSHGVAWQQHVWGGVPAASGAVRFDQATLTLRGVGTLELVRSRRSSGRGTPVVTARLLDGTRWRAVEGAVWPLVTGGTGGSVRIATLGVDVILSRLVLPGETGPLPDPVAWRGVLFARGSHAGAGFAELAPLEVTDDGA